MTDVKTHNDSKFVHILEAIKRRPDRSFGVFPCQVGEMKQGRLESLRSPPSSLKSEFAGEHHSNIISTMAERALLFLMSSLLKELTFLGDIPGPEQLSL